MVHRLKTFREIKIEKAFFLIKSSDGLIIEAIVSIKWRGEPNCSTESARGVKEPFAKAGSETEEIFEIALDLPCNTLENNKTQTRTKNIVLDIRW